MKILIAEDEFIMRKIMEMQLKKDGHEIVCAADGLEALEKTRAAQPDLVISDLNMPGASGLEVVKLIREELGLSIPVIILSGTGEEEVKKEAFALGASAFISKPVSPNGLSEMIKKYQKIN
ncbi:MAG TPA: response regulator [Chitinophagaceae bacterium]|nr:response regulator [Chitinophagaceae bacterium]